MASEESLYYNYQSVFEPLHHNTQYFRLLHIQPAESEYDLVQSTLHAVRLNSKAKYIAISLKPTEEPFDHAIICNEKLLRVTESLHDLLKVRRQLGWQWFWLEELCVNRKNAVEHEQQQRVLSTIYREAINMVLPGFEYNTLPGPEYIRLIEIELPGPIAAPHYTVTIHSVSLDDRPEFSLVKMASDGFKAEDGVMRTVVTNRQALKVDWAVIETLRILRPVLSPGVLFWLKPLCVNSGNSIDVDHHKLLEDRMMKQAREEVVINLRGYDYVPLDNLRNEIRLLAIRPSYVQREQVIVEVVTVSLDENPQYCALSYFWGPDIREYPVFCPNGRRFLTTQNLWNALGAIRDTFPGGVMLWTDQICVNQNDLEERGSQILLMNRIYKQASEVIIHLSGEFKSQNRHSWRTHWAILLRILALTARTLRCVRPERPLISPEEFSKFGIPPFQHRSWRLLQLLRANPWFSRGWVVQEAVEGRRVWAIFDRQRFNFDDLHLASSSITSEPIPTGERHAVIGRRLLNDFNTLRPQMASVDQRHRHLVNLLINFRYVDTRDQRDKIWAFRGMAIDGDKAPLPNMFDTPEKVYLDYARHLLDRGQGLELLREGGLAKSTMDIPSWVVDWSYNQHSGACNFTRSPGFPPIVDVPQESIVKLELTDDVHTIVAKAAIFDDIIGITSVYREKDSLPEESIIKVDNEAQALFQTHLSSSSSVYAEGLQISHAKTLIADYDSFSDVAAVYAALKEDMRIVLKHGRNSAQTNAISMKIDVDSRRYASRLNPAILTRRFGVTRRGYMGLFPFCTVQGDLLCVFKGCNMPLVLRKQAVTGEKEYYQLVGDVYVHGLMGGEAWGLQGLQVERIMLR